jgi:hypothetical protein
MQRFVATGEMRMAKNKGNPEVDALDEEALARYFEERAGDLSIWEEKPIKIRSRRGGPSVVFSVRLTPQELEVIRLAADGNVSDFIRRVSLERARADLDKKLSARAAKA